MKVTTDIISKLLTKEFKGKKVIKIDGRICELKNPIIKKVGIDWEFECFYIVTANDPHEISCNDFEVQNET